MKVELIDYTGRSSLNPAIYSAELLIAAKSTRLGNFAAVDAKLNALTKEERAKELTYIANSIRSSWEFINYTFRISGVSIACRDQIVRSRHASFAVMAGRVVDQSNFNYVIPETIRANDKLCLAFEEWMALIAEFYSSLIAEGIPTQDARAVIPMAAESNLTAGYNLRSLADIVAKRENARAQGEYVEVAREMKRLVLEVHPWADEFLSPERLATPALDNILRGLLGTRGPLELPEVNEALKEIDKLKAVWG